MIAMAIGRASDETGERSRLTNGLYPAVIPRPPPFMAVRRNVDKPMTCADSPR